MTIRKTIRSTIRRPYFDLVHPGSGLNLNLQFETLADTGNSVGPSISVGWDGALYYIRALRVIRLAEPPTGTKELGIVWSGQYPSFMYRFKSGMVYVVNIEVEGVKKVEVRKAADHNTAYTVVATLEGGHTNRIACNAFTDGSKEYLMIGGYEQTKEIQRFMYLSTDGGETFTNVKTTSGTDIIYNWHWHAAYYDRFNGRLWISEGDDPSNRGIWYSDNLGVSWTKINSNAYQPTLIFSFPETIFFGRDAGYPGMYKIVSEDVGTTNVLDDALTFRIDKAGANYYPSGTHAQFMSMAYVSFDAKIPDERNYIYATKDNGKNWLKVRDELTTVSGLIAVNGYIVGISGEWNGYSIVYAKPILQFPSRNDVIVESKVFDSKNFDGDQTPLGIIITNTNGNNALWSESINIYDSTYLATTGTAAEKHYAACKAAAMWRHYSSNAANGKIYGKMYNGFAALLFALDVEKYNAVNINNPYPYDLPTEAEIIALANGLGGVSVAGGKMKQIGTERWKSPNTGATNESGFTALPGGVILINGASVDITNNAYFWTKTFVTTSNMRFFGLGYNTEKITISGVALNQGYSIRLIKRV